MPLQKLKQKTTPELKTLKITETFRLECGQHLDAIEIAYTTWGSLNNNRDNVVWVFHALTGNGNPREWWPGLFGEGTLFNPEDHYIVCANVIGSCYGSTGPTSLDGSGKPYLNDFPLITIRDMVRVHQILYEELRIGQIFVGIGGSLGGQQLLQWAAWEPSRFEFIIPLATNARHSPWGIAFNEAQRMALKADTSFYSGNIDGGSEGLKAARAIALLSYRSKEIFDRTQQESGYAIDNFRASSYQRYQGEKLAKRFNALAYYTLSKAMDNHNLANDYLTIEEALGRIRSRTLAIGIKSDLLFPIEEQKFIADHIPGAELKIVDTDFGHDGFLVETEKIKNIITDFFEKWKK